MGVAEAGRVERVPARELVRAEFQARHWAPLVLYFEQFTSFGVVNWGG